MIAAPLTPDQRLALLERRVQVLEDNCARCPGYTEPQDFELDVFPSNHPGVDDFKGERK